MMISVQGKEAKNYQLAGQTRTYKMGKQIELNSLYPACQKKRQLSQNQYHQIKNKNIMMMNFQKFKTNFRNIFNSYKIGI